MSKLINQKEIQNMFYEFLRESDIKVFKKKNFENFLKFLEIDFYDWIKENLRSYFKNES